MVRSGDRIAQQRTLQPTQCRAGKRRTRATCNDNYGQRGKTGTGAGRLCTWGYSHIAQQRPEGQLRNRYLGYWRSQSPLGYPLVSSWFGQEKLYTEGTVWKLTFVKLEPGMFGVYMGDAVVGRARVFVDEDLARTELVVLDLDFGLQVR